MPTEKVLLLYNPAAGKGSGRQVAEALSARLKREGLETLVIEARASISDRTCEEFCRDARASIVVGGDGTLMDLLEFLSSLETPVYMVPGGNESLFSRQFSMSRREDEIVRAVSSGSSGEHCYGLAGDKAFFSMVSVGFDSLTVHRISKRRSGPIGHIGYLIPGLRALLEYSTPRVSLSVDGKQVIDREPGYLIIANSPQYAGKINPVPEAKTDQPILHARFYPNQSVLSCLGWVWKILCHRQVRTEGSRVFTGTTFLLDADSAYPVQADGDHIGFTPIRVSVSPKRLRVLAIVS